VKGIDKSCCSGASGPEAELILERESGGRVEKGGVKKSVDHGSLH